MHQNFDLELPLKKFSLVYMLFQTAGASFWQGRRTSAFHNLPKPGFTPSGFSSSQACRMSIRYSPTILTTKNTSANHYRHLGMLPHSTVLTRINSYIQ